MRTDFRWTIRQQVRCAVDRNVSDKCAKNAFGIYDAVIIVVADRIQFINSILRTLFPGKPCVLATEPSSCPSFLRGLEAQCGRRPHLTVLT